MSGVWFLAPGIGHRVAVGAGSVHRDLVVFFARAECLAGGPVKTFARVVLSRLPGYVGLLRC